MVDAGMPMVDAYRLIDRIGSGSTGEVWSAEPPHGGPPVAVKILDPELMQDQDAVARFLQERAILTGLRSPHLVRVHDLVVDDGTLAIVMDLVDGPNLRDHAARTGTLPPAVAVELAGQVLGALAVVHRAGIVHRDVKPENILLQLGPDRPRALLTDFGVAQIVEDPAENGVGGLIGTVSYAAPEVCLHGLSSVASDLYAVGVVLYELLSGRPPFEGLDPYEIIRAHQDDAPPPVPGLPPAVRAELDRLLAKDPAARPPSATAAHQALLRAARTAPAAPALAAQPALGGYSGPTVPPGMTPAVGLPLSPPLDTPPAGIALPATVSGVPRRVPGQLVAASVGPLDRAAHAAAFASGAAAFVAGAAAATGEIAPGTTPAGSSQGFDEDPEPGGAPGVPTRRAAVDPFAELASDGPVDGAADGADDGPGRNLPPERPERRAEVAPERLSGPVEPLLPDRAVVAQLDPAVGSPDDTPPRGASPLPVPAPGTASMPLAAPTAPPGVGRTMSIPLIAPLAAPPATPLAVPPATPPAVPPATPPAVPPATPPATPTSKSPTTAAAGLPLPGIVARGAAPATPPTPTAATLGVDLLAGPAGGPAEPVARTVHVDATTAEAPTRSGPKNWWVASSQNAAPEDVMEGAEAADAMFVPPPVVAATDRPTPTDAPTHVFTPADEPPAPTWSTGSIRTPDPETPSRLWLVLVPLGVLVVAATIVVALVLGGFGKAPDAGPMPPAPTPSESVSAQQSQAVTAPTPTPSPSAAPTPDPQVVVPALVGDRATAAVADLRELELKASVGRTCRRGAKPGRVVAQKPTADVKVDAGDRVVLQVQDDDCVLVPDVRGRTINQAREALLRAGFRDMQVISPPGTDWNYGRVTGQVPAPGPRHLTARARIASDGRGVDGGRPDENGGPGRGDFRA